MFDRTQELAIDPSHVLALGLPELASAPRRGLLRALLLASGGAVRVDGAERLAAAPAGSLFALTHHNAWEAVLAPATLVALRRGRLVRFLVDWMFVDLPWTGWLVRQIDPIPIYQKRARFGLRERHRRSRIGAIRALERAVEALTSGQDVGIYPEGRRNPDPWLLQPGRPGLGILAMRSGAPVVPVGIDFPARDRLRRLPRVGRFVLRVGEPLEFRSEREHWLAASGARARRQVERDLAPGLVSRVLDDLARLARKVHVPRALPERASRQSERTTAAALPLAGAAIAVERVRGEASRQDALRVIDEVYRREKRWLRSVESEIQREPERETGACWLLARCEGEPVGVVRLVFDPALELPEEAGLELAPGLDLGRLAARGRFVEVGRLMIRESWRAKPGIVLELMREAVGQVLERGYTHLLTAVFEDDPHSPYRFHTRVLGFERIGSHAHGELASESRRILLVLDLERAIRRVRARGGRLGGLLTAGLERRFACAGLTAETQRDAGGGSPAVSVS